MRNEESQLRNLWSRIEDHVLRFIQKRCEHPGHMVALDILEGGADGFAVTYCNRCGSVRTDWKLAHGFRKYVDPAVSWRTPDPFLWRETGWLAASSKPKQ
jgi:hypothetical protein